MQQTERVKFAVGEVGAVAAWPRCPLADHGQPVRPAPRRAVFRLGARNLAWGYPDQPSFTQLIARLATELAPHSLIVLRLPSLIAMILLVVCAAAFARYLAAAGPRSY